MNAKPNDGILTIYRSHGVSKTRGDNTTAEKLKHFVSFDVINWTYVTQDEQSEQRATHQDTDKSSQRLTAVKRKESSIDDFTTKNPDLYETLTIYKTCLESKTKFEKLVAKKQNTIETIMETNESIKKTSEEKDKKIKIKDKELTEAKTVINREKKHKRYLILLSVIILGIAIGLYLYSERLETKLEQEKQLNHDQLDQITTLENSLKRMMANMTTPNKSPIHKLFNRAQKLFGKQH